MRTGYTYDCGCIGGNCDCHGFTGLGSFDAPGGSPSGGGDIVQTAINLISNELKATINNAVAGFGSGHGEADIIVPVQNRLAVDLDRIFNSWRTAPMPILLSLYEELKALKSTFIQFVSDPRFTDGRASQQALDDIIPLIDENLSGISARIVQMGGALPNPALPVPYVAGMSSAGVGGSMSTPTMLMLGVGALLLLKGKIRV